jgi:formate dehydrogenase subunit gamma
VTSATVVRFDRVTRWVHWATALCGGVALGTGTVLYVPMLSAPIGQRAAIRELHVVASLFLVAPLMVGVLAGSRGRRLRRDLTELSRWTPADRRWLRRTTRGAPVGKFNGGQKLITALFAGLFVMQLVSGSVMFWHDPFRDSWRTGATFVHDWAFLGLAVAVVGHLVKAAGEPELMRAMTRGSVPEAWAVANRPTWDREDQAGTIQP